MIHQERVNISCNSIDLSESVRARSNTALDPPVPPWLRILVPVEVSYVIVNPSTMSAKLTTILEILALAPTTTWINIKPHMSSYLAHTLKVVRYDGASNTKVLALFDTHLSSEVEVDEVCA